MKNYLGILYMILSGLFFGGVWIFSKMLVQDISPFTFTSLRLWSGFFVLCLLGRKFFPKIFSISGEDRKRIIVIAIFGMAWGAICFTLSVKRTTVTNSSFLFFLPAALLPLGGALFSKLTLRVTTYVAVVLCVLGLYFLFDPDIVGTSFIGNAFGLLAGLSNVFYIVMSKKVSHIPPKLYSIVVFGVLVGVISLLTFAIEGNQLGEITLASWEIIGYLGACIAGAYYFINTSLQYISSYLVSILAIREPLAATALGVLFLGEIITLSGLIGLGAILLGFGLISLDKVLME